MEERVENGVSNPSHRAKLRRRLNGFPFDSKFGNSYMEKLLNSPSPDDKVRHEMIENSSPPLMFSINDTENMETSHSPFPDRTIHELNEVPEDNKICKRSNSCPSIDKVICEKVKTVDAESSSFSDSPTTSAENPQSEKTSPKRFPSAEIPEVELVDVSSYQKPSDEFFPVDQDSKSMISDYTCSNTGAITDHISDIDMTFSSDSEGVERKGRLWGLESDEMASTLAKEENKTDLVIHPPSSHNVSNPESQFGDDSPRSSAGEPLMEETNVENVPCVSTVSHKTDNSVTISADLLHEDQSYCEDHNLGENTTSMLDTYVVLSQNSNCSSEITESLIEGKLEDEVQEVPENVSSNYSDIAYSGANIESTVSKEEYLVVESDHEDSNVSTVAQKCSPCIMEASPGRTLEETSLANAETVDSEENHSNSSIDSQIASEIKLSNLESSSNLPPESVDAHDRDVIHEEETSSTSDTVENNLVTLSTSPSGLKLTEISITADLKSLNEVHILSDELNSDTHKANPAHSSALHAASDYTERDDVGLPVGINKLVEEQITSCEEVRNDENCLSGSYMVSGLGEEVDQTEGVESNSKSDVSDTVLSHHDLDIEQECLQENGLGNYIAGPSLPIDDDIEESVLHEQIELPELPYSSEISSELSPQTPIKQQMLDHKESNNSSSIMSLVSYANPPSSLDIPRLSNHGINLVENPKDSLGSNFPSNQRTNQINLDKLPPLPPPPVQWIMGKIQHALSTTADERTRPEEFPREIITSDVSSSIEELNHSRIQISHKNKSKEEVVENSPSSLEAIDTHEKTELLTKINNNQHQFVTPTSDSESTSAAKADGISNRSRVVRLPRLDNPRIDYVAAIDKSRLRKVTERVRPEIEKLDEKDSFLEQIKAKSFNLKPAVASRPSIQGPKTNLNVAAILEKANAIRQAFADNGDDDEDSWSDS